MKLEYKLEIINTEFIDRRVVIMNGEFMDALSVILVISIATVILSPLLCWVIAQKPSA
jgi:hypothetical protein